MIRPTREVPVHIWTATASHMHMQPEGLEARPTAAGDPRHPPGAPSCRAHESVMTNAVQAAPTDAIASWYRRGLKGERSDSAHSKLA